MSKFFKLNSILILGLVFQLAWQIVFQPQNCFAAGKKRSVEENKPLKKVISLDPIDERFIELPDPITPKKKYGSSLYLRLIEELQSTRDYAVLLNPVQEDAVCSHCSEGKEILGMSRRNSAEPDPVLDDSAPISSMRINVDINELSFVTGSRGERMLYGFQKEFENNYNGGRDATYKNDYPIRLDQTEVSWFDQEFKDYGGLHTGLDLGHEINFDVLLAGADLKKAEYHATMGAEVTFTDYLGQKEKRSLKVKAKGFFFDLSGHLVVHGVDYMLGVMLARNVALRNAFDRLIAATAKLIADEMKSTPLMGRLIWNTESEQFFSLGADYHVQVGQRFYSLKQWKTGETPAIIVVDKVFQTQSQVHIIGENVENGEQFVSVDSNSNPPSVPEEILAQSARKSEVLGLFSFNNSAEKIQSISKEMSLDDVDIDLPDELEKYKQNIFGKIISNIKNLVTLPYRVWRYLQYDQEYKGGKLKVPSVDQAIKLAGESWALRKLNVDSVWRKFGLGKRNVIVALIDSGVDYNHKELRQNIFWDGGKDTPGYDFISGDPRPYDDHAHGTEVASVMVGGGEKIIGVAPNVTLMPLKVFSPYGITTSGSMFAAFQYAIENGAKIIVLGWASKKYSYALDEAIALAQSKGILVVVSAGDGGYNLDELPHYPAAFAKKYNNMLVVASQTQQGYFTSFTNQGSVVDIAAPGDQLVVADPRNRYSKRSHTSLAVGYVAGAAALILSYCPRFSYDEVKTMILESSSDFSYLDASDPRGVPKKGLFLRPIPDLINQHCF